MIFHPCREVSRWTGFWRLTQQSRVSNFLSVAETIGVHLLDVMTSSDGIFVPEVPEERG